ncbi:hypothetical protein BGZ76_011847 [Entomortierella beljakovae]|nr:hypothetical protein BGZ76_011847 [Entomortierella beljakovae]
MLFPSTPLFNSVTGAGSPAKSGGKGPKLRHSLFNRSKKQQQHEQQEPTTKNSSTTGWSSSSPWPGWIGDTGESRKQSTYPSDHNGGMNPTNTPSSKSWMLRPSNKSCKSDTEATTPPPLRENFFKKKKKTLVVNSSHVNSSHDEKSCTSDNEVGSAGEQIMLRPYYNLSNPSVMSINNNTMYPSSTSSPPPNDQLWLPPQHYQQQQQHYSLQEQSYFFQNHQLQQQQQQQQQGSQQQLHHPSRRGVTLAVHDVFGLGKVIEMILALFSFEPRPTVKHENEIINRKYNRSANMLTTEVQDMLVPQAPTTTATGKTCKSGYYNKGLKNAPDTYCCATNNDCIGSCTYVPGNSYMCTGGTVTSTTTSATSGVSTTTTSTSTTTSTPTLPTGTWELIPDPDMGCFSNIECDGLCDNAKCVSYPAPNGCTPGRQNSRTYDSYGGMCCYHNDDCFSGRCSGYVCESAELPSCSGPNCIVGHEGDNNANLPLKYCCKDGSDCLYGCTNGACIAGHVSSCPRPTKTTTTTTSTQTSKPEPTTIDPEDVKTGVCDICGPVGGIAIGLPGLVIGFTGIFVPLFDNDDDETTTSTTTSTSVVTVPGTTTSIVLPTSSSTSATISSSSTSGTIGAVTSTTTATGKTCKSGYYNKGLKNAPDTYCCANSNDCIGSCEYVPGDSYMCTGGTVTSTTTNGVTSTTTTRTSTTTSTPTPTCIVGYCGLGNGRGPTGACCSTEADCMDTCNANGKCGVSDETWTINLVCP